MDQMSKVLTNEAIGVTNWQCKQGMTAILKLGTVSIMETEVFEKGCSYFDLGEYFEAHESWEEIWIDAYGARRYFLQGLIQAAVALHHARNQNWVGTRKLSATALDYLERGRSEGPEIDIDVMKDRIIDFEVALQKLLTGENVELPFYKLPRR
jgi:predicted metal-dependent hydrolase